MLAVEETLILCGLAGFFEDYVPVFFTGKLLVNLDYLFRSSYMSV